MIVPATFAALSSGDAVAQNSGPSLMFIILPQVFENLGGAATIIGVVFFVLVLFAALTSSLSLVETCIVYYFRRRWLVSQALAYRDYRVRDAHGCAREPGLQVAVVHQLDGRGLEHPRFARLHLQLGDDAYRCASYLRFRGLDYQAPKRSSTRCVSARFRPGQLWSVVIKYIAPVMLVVILIAYVAQDHESVQHSRSASRSLKGPACFVSVRLSGDRDAASGTFNFWASAVRSVLFTSA